MGFTGVSFSPQKQWSCFTLLIHPLKLRWQAGKIIHEWVDVFPCWNMRIFFPTNSSCDRFPGCIPSWELTYPIKIHFWRWVSFSPGAYKLLGFLYPAGVVELERWHQHSNCTHTWHGRQGGASGYDSDLPPRSKLTAPEVFRAAKNQSIKINQTIDM